MSPAWQCATPRRFAFVAAAEFFVSSLEAKERNHSQLGSGMIFLGTGNSNPPGLEKLFQQSSSRFAVAGARDIGTVVTSRLLKESRTMLDRPALRIGGRVHHARHASKAHRRSAHRARL